MPWFKGIIIMHNLFFKLSKAQAPQFLILRIKENTVIGNQFTVSEGSKTEPTLLSNELFAALFSKRLLYSIIEIILSSMVYFSFPLQFNGPKKGRGFQPTKVAPNRGPGSTKYANGGNRENVSQFWIYCGVGLLRNFFIFPLKEHVRHFCGKKCRILTYF